MKVTNISKGPRGLHASTGPIVLDPRQEADVDMTPTEHASSHRTGWFDMPAPAAGDDEPADRTALKSEADALGIAYARNIPTDRLRELVEAKRTGQGD